MTQNKNERDKNAINIFLNSFCWDWCWSLLSFYVIQIYLIFVVCADKIYKSDKFFQGRGVFEDKLASCFTCEMCDTLFCGLKGEKEGVVSFYWIIYFKFMCNFDTKICVWKIFFFVNIFLEDEKKVSVDNNLSGIFLHHFIVPSIYIRVPKFTQKLANHTNLRREKRKEMSIYFD